MNPEPAIGDMMAVGAQHAVEYAQGFDITLDYSPASIASVEEILTVMYDERPRGWMARLLRRGPSEELVQQMSAMFGAYVGEVMRRARGGEWEMADVPGAAGALSLRTGEHILFPTSKVYKRLANGPEDSIETYFRVIEQQRATGPEPV